MVQEASLKPTAAGLVPAGNGWFILNARDAGWRRREGMGAFLSFEGETDFPQIGVTLYALAPGERMAMYHWEADQEDFFVLSGEARLIIESEERRLRQWDFVHCPAETKHAIVGAGNGLCVVLAVGARQHPASGAFPVDQSAARHGAGVDQDTADPKQAYAPFPAPDPTRYRDGWLPN